MPTAVNVTRLFSIALDGATVYGQKSSPPEELQPAAGPLMLPDDASEWVELAPRAIGGGYLSAESVSGGLHPEFAGGYIHDGKFSLNPFFSGDTAGLISVWIPPSSLGYRFPAGTTMQFGLIAPPGTNLTFYPRPGNPPQPYCWWDSDGYWAVDSLDWGMLSTPAEVEAVRIFIVITASALTPPPQPSEFWTNFIGSHEII